MINYISWIDIRGNPDCAEVGKVFYYETIKEKCKVLEIKEHQAGGEGDKWFWEIHLEGKNILTIFNPTETIKTKEIE